MKLRNFLCILLLFVTVFVFASCSSSNKTKTKTFTVTFNSNGGSEVAAATVNSGEKATAPEDPTQDGYAFEGWYLSSKKWNFAEDAIVTNITLTAKWTKLYTVTIDPANGAEATTLTLKEGETITKPADPTAAGKNFLGWYAENSKWNFSDPVEADIKLTAKWETVYTVTFDTDGAGTIDPQVVVAGSKATAPADPVKAEYIFEGWYNGDKQWIFADNAVNNNSSKLLLPVCNILYSYVHSNGKWIESMNSTNMFKDGYDSLFEAFGKIKPYCYIGNGAQEVKIQNANSLTRAELIQLLQEVQHAYDYYLSVN